MIYLLDQTISKQFYHKYLFNSANTRFPELMLSITITASEINNDKHYYTKVLIRLYQSRIGDYGPSNRSLTNPMKKTK